MDYNKINKIDTDGSGNIVLQDVNGSAITVNYNDIETIKLVLQNISESQTFEIKQLIVDQTKNILSEIRNIQDRLDEDKTNHTIDNLLGVADGFPEEIASLKMGGAKNRILMNYRLLREYEEKLVFVDDPKRTMKYEYEIKSIKENIEKDERELIKLTKQ